MPIRGILLVGISSTGPLGIKMTPDVDQALKNLFTSSNTQNVPINHIIQGKRNHLEKLEFRSVTQGLEIFGCFKKIPNMTQELIPGEWISLGLVRNPEKILSINGILQTKTFKEIAEQAERVEPNEWNTPMQDREFVEFFGSCEGYIPESC